MYSPLFTYRKRTKLRMNSFSACILSASRDVITEFPRIPPAGGAFIISYGVLRVGDPDLYVIYCHFCTKYELICSINAFCMCIRPYLRTENVQNHLRISFSSPPVGGAFIIYSGRSPRRRPRLYIIYFHLCTKYKLICSFNTFCTCIHPYYVQKMYKTVYEFHFSANHYIFGDGPRN